MRPDQQPLQMLFISPWSLRSRACIRRSNSSRAFLASASSAFSRAAIWAGVSAGAGAAARPLAGSGRRGRRGGRLGRSLGGGGARHQDERGNEKETHAANNRRGRPPVKEAAGRRDAALVGWRRVPARRRCRRAAERGRRLGG